MAVAILRGDDIACLYSSNTDWAFGPVFYSNDKKSADERAEAFLRYLNSDPRLIEAPLLERLYSDWLGQEERQYQQEASEEELACRA